ncbi:permease [Oryzobacter sp. R7]|uniref:permease n=1 Tax=Oryzobacter faecalis TaxID=3388656 RepID=UPI00398CC713
MDPVTREPAADPPLRRRSDLAREREDARRRASEDGDGRRGGDWSMVALSVVMLGLILLRPWLGSFVDAQAALAAWLTVFVSIGLQALPFLVLGVVLSAVIAVLVPADALTRWLPRRPVAAVPVAGLSGLVLPGCECASVPIAGSLVSRGVKPAVALTFLLAAPAINPVVLVSTAVAFAGRWEMVGARFSASLLTAVVMGWLWLRLGRDHLIRMPSRRTTGHGRLADLVAAARHDLLHAGGFLVVGSAVAATVNVLVPRAVLDTLAGSLLVSVLVLAGFAVIIAVCSEADAFVAASLSQFPPTAQLAFMVVGPAVDVKLFAMQAGTFGRQFATVFAPLTFLVAIASALAVGAVLL